MEDKSRLVFAYDWCGCLDTFPELRAHANRVYEKGHEVHIISGTGDPEAKIEGLSGKPYPVIAAELGVPYTALHIAWDHSGEEIAKWKAAVLVQIKANSFFDDRIENVQAARDAGINAVLITAETLRGLWAEPNLVIFV